jgi:hypothetical protein
VSYTSSLLYQPAGVKTEALPAGQVSADSSTARHLVSSQQVPAVLLKQEPVEQQQQHSTFVPMQAYGSFEKHRKGSSCSSSSAATPDGNMQAVLGGKAATASPAAASGFEQAAPACTERDMQLLNELLAESADLVGTALQLDIDAPAVAAMQQPCRMKRHRSSTPQLDPLQQHTQQAGATAELLSAAACAEHAALLPSINLPSIVHIYDSAEEQQLSAPHSHSSSSDDSKRLKRRPSSGILGSRGASTQDCMSAQLLQQQEQYQKLQAVHQQLQQSFTVMPVEQEQQQQQQQRQQQMGTVSATAAAAAAALKHIQQHESTFDQQLEALMQHAGLCNQAQQQAPTSNALFAAQAGHGFWGLGGQTVPMQCAGYAASDLQLLQQQQQQQMEQYNTQYMACSGMPVGSSSSQLGGNQWPTTDTGAHMQLLQPQQQAAAQQVMSAALAVAQGGGANAAYQPVDSSLRMSLKLHNTEPHHLQPEMLPRLNALLGSSGSCSTAADAPGAAAAPGMRVECGYMRPGCVHLVLQLRSAADMQAAAAALAEAGQGLDASSWTWALLGSSPVRSSSSTRDPQQQQQPPASITVQLGSHSVVLLRDGKLNPAGAAALQQLLQHGRLPAAGANSSMLTAPDQQQAVLPRLDAVLPCCISSRGGAVVDGRCQLLALGSGLTRAAADVGGSGGGTSAPVLLARCQGMFLSAEATPAAPLQAETMLQLLQHARRNRQAAVGSSAGPAEQCVTLTVQGLQLSGLVHLEFMQGLLLSESRPLLVVDNDAVAAELQGLQAACMAGQQPQREAEHVLVDFGRLLDFRAAARRAAITRQHQAAAFDDGSSTSEQQQVPASVRRSISAPLPDVTQQGGASQPGDVPSLQSYSGSCLPSSSMQKPAAAAAAAAAAQAAPAAASDAGMLQQLADASSKATSSSSSFRTSLQKLLGRRSFAMESVPPRGSDQSLGAAVGPRREVSVPCFPVGLHRASFSFHRRNSIDAAAGVSAEHSQDSSSHRGAAVGASSVTLPPTGRNTDGNSSSDSKGGSSFVWWKHLGEQQQQPPVARHASDPVCRSEQQPPVVRHASDPVCRSPPLQGVQHSAAGLSEAALAQRWQLQQQQQGARGGLDPSAAEDLDQADQSSKEGDSVSSFVKVSPGANAGACQHPLLTLQYKGLMM